MVDNFYDETFFVALSVILFVAITYKFIKKVISEHVKKEVKNAKQQLKEAAQLKKEAENLLAEYLEKQQTIQLETDQIIVRTDEAIKKIYDNAESKLIEIIKEKTEQSLKRINQYEANLLYEIRLQAVEIAFLAIRSIIKDKLSSNDAEKILAQISEQISSTHIN
jgi:F-type H+-transporting ATPase subunit b